MAPKRTPRPQWIDEAVTGTVAEIMEHAAIRIEEIELQLRGEHHEGQIAPALIAAVQDALKASLDQMGLQAVQTYTEARKAQGATAQEAQGEELGPLLGLSRAGVYHGFGRDRG